jgi:UDP-N-acetylglucosamine 2-epimerase (non-hydrolysing)
MKPKQTLAGFTSRALVALDQVFRTTRPDLVLVQGDTTTVLSASLAAYYQSVAIGHLEAGLRTGDKKAPFPEEMNRVLTSHLADLHFAPTAWAANNLRREGISSERIHITGNTVIDALFHARDRLKKKPLQADSPTQQLLHKLIQSKQPLVLITGHRRESFGSGFEKICAALRTLAVKFPTVNFVYPVHLNPHVREPVFRCLSGLPNLHLIEPLAYLPFVYLLQHCSLVLTDSGGIQEEAPSFGKPVLVMRDKTERPEGIKAGCVKLVGTDSTRIVRATSRLLSNPTAYEAMSQVSNPYGDGQASTRIVALCLEFLSR